MTPKIGVRQFGYCLLVFWLAIFFAPQPRGEEQAAQPANTPATPTDWSPLLPAGPGKEYAVALCGGCHTVGILALQRRSRQGWKDSLEGMNAARQTAGELCACLGGPLYKDEIDIISSYLAEAFGPKNPFDQLPLNLNNASRSAILRLPGLAPADAQKIIEARQRAAFQSKQEIEKLLGREKFQQIENFVDVKDSNFRSEGLLPM